MPALKQTCPACKRLIRVIDPRPYATPYYARHLIGKRVAARTQDSPRSECLFSLCSTPLTTDH
jgi:hypothetical protein